MIVSVLISFLSSSLCRARLKRKPLPLSSQETESAESVEVYVNKQSAKKKRLVTLKSSNVDFVLIQAILSQKVCSLCTALQHCKLKTVCKKYKTCCHATESERAENASCPAAVLLYMISSCRLYMISQGAPCTTCSCKNVQGSWGYISQ